MKTFAFDLISLCNNANSDIRSTACWCGWMFSICMPYITDKHSSHVLQHGNFRELPWRRHSNKAVAETMAKMRKLSLNVSYNSTCTEHLKDFQTAETFALLPELKQQLMQLTFHNSHLEPFNCVASPKSVVCRLICTVPSQLCLCRCMLLFMHRCLDTNTFGFSVRACGKIMTLTLQSLKQSATMFQTETCCKAIPLLSRLLKWVLTCSIFVKKLISSVLLT